MLLQKWAGNYFLRAKMSGKCIIIKTRENRSIPLVPVFISIFSFIVMLSPLAWQTGLMLYFVLGMIGLSLVCAYSTTMFMDSYFEGKS